MSGRERFAPVSLTLLTGFLGAGKTSLLNRLAGQGALPDTLVIVNEIGEISLDHLLMERLEGDVVALSGGCLCCAVRSDLIETFEDLLRRRDEGSLPAFRRVVLETTGLADPVPVLHAMQAHPLLQVRFALDGVIAVVDALTGARALCEHEEARRQVALADRVVLTKTDLVADDEARAAEAELRRRLAELAPGAPVLDAARGEAVAERLFDVAPWTIEGRSEAVKDWLRAEADGTAATAHTGDIRTTTLWSDTALPPEAFGLFTDLLRSEFGANILRLKGLVRTTLDPERPVLIHGVQHVFHPPRRLDAWPDADRRTRIVVIGRDLHAEGIARLYEAFGSMAAPRPDVLLG
ncbi:CobW family GTP-binding protein [Terrihabitans sp. B22-R8]|uniref:CobW family GTP-binding protein n=1 Tax=Terrihabitans sp. B22-R8 TaxID=3425128 RepID=UPI00403D4A56